MLQKCYICLCVFNVDYYSSILFFSSSMVENAVEMQNDVYTKKCRMKGVHPIMHITQIKLTMHIKVVYVILVSYV